MTDTDQKKNETLDMVKEMALMVWGYQAGIKSKPGADSKNILSDWKSVDIATIAQLLCKTSADLRVQARAPNSPLTTPDFPPLVGQALATGAAFAWPETVERLFWTRPIRLPDFRENYLLTSTPPALTEQAEGAEILPGRPLVSKETVLLKTYSRTVRIGDRLYYNDRSGIFVELGRQFALSAASKAADLCFGMLTDNPNLADGEPWLAVAAGNQASAGAALDATSLGAALAGLRAQTVNGLRLNLNANFLLVGGGDELTARQLTRKYFAERELIVIADDRLTGYGFFLLANPKILPAVVRLQLVPNEPLALDVRRIDAGLEIKALCDLGAAPVNRTGIYWTPAP